MRDWVGLAVPRTEDERLLRGAGRYVANIKRPGEVHAVFVRSPFAHARIERIDVSEARRMPGVVAVLTHADTPGGTLPPFLWDLPPDGLVEALDPLIRPCHPPFLASDRVRFIGQPVVMLLAEEPSVAEDAVESVRVDYEALPVLASVETALHTSALALHDGWPDNVAVRLEVRKGDVAEAFSVADVVIRDRFAVQRQAGVPMETRGAVGDFDTGSGHLTLWSSTQNPHPLQRAMSRVSGLPVTQVRVIAPDVGGGFGTKGVLYPEDLLVGLAAIELRRPVKWVEGRQEHMQSAIHAREQVHDIELAVAADGRILGLRDHFVVDNGAFNPLGLVIPHNTITHLMGPYRVPSLEAVGTCVVTNKVPTAPYRGAGRPEAVFAMERILERTARELGIDPVEFRRRNLIRPDEMPYPAGILYRDGQPQVLDSGNYPEALRRATELIGYEEAKASRGAMRRGRHLGVGFACYLEGTGIGPFEGAAIGVDREGHVTVHTGACSQGQGHATAFAQVCADALGVDLADVTIVGGDTAGIERGWGTVASRSAVVAGNAVADASIMVRDQALKRAADLLEVSEEDLVFRGGTISVVGAPAKNVTFASLAEAAVSEGSTMEATAYYEPPTVTWANGTHAARVEVDVETGQVKILDYVVVHDCGTVINPIIVEGQILGGVAQGIAGALYEELSYTEDGQLLNGTLIDYLVPTAEEMPHVVIDHMETPSPLNPLGVKGVGEGGAVPPPAALVNAVEDALSPFGVVVRRTPLSPAYVRSLLDEAATTRTNQPAS